jgi:hypothetical protein
MQELSTDVVGQVCRVFLALAYPGGENTIPLKRHCYLTLPPGQSLVEFLQASTEARPFCERVVDAHGDHVGYTLRLGSAGFPHLKLRVSNVNPEGEAVWVFGVDTHDAYSATSYRPPPGHRDAEPWARLQAANQRLKEEIERAWEEAGLLTFNGLLRSDLERVGAGRPS